MSVLGTQVFANPTTPLWLSSSTIVPTGPTGPSGFTGATGPTGPSATALTQYGKITGAGGTGNQAVTLPVAYSNTNYVVMVTMEDTSPAQMSANITANNAFTIYWANASGGSHTIAWLAVGV